jgi:hypothetical protein
MPEEDAHLMVARKIKEKERGGARVSILLSRACSK